MKKLKISFHPFFVIFLFVILFSNSFISVFSYVLCVILHELGHGAMANLLGYKLNKITFLPFGASISGKENVFYKPSHEILVAISGPFVNLVLIIFCYALFWIFPVMYPFLQSFYYANLTTFIFNFLPVYPLDGGRVLYALLKKKKPINKSYKTIKIIGIIFSALLFFLFIASSFFTINFTLGLTSVFLLAGIFFEDKTSFYVTNFSFINKTNKLNVGIETNVISVGEDAILYNILRKLNKFKYNLVIIIGKNGKVLKSFSEEEMNNIFLSSFLDQKIIEFIN